MDELKQILHDLAHNPFFWGAVYGVIEAGQRWLAPNVPDYFMIAVNILFVVVTSTIAGQQVVAAWRVRTNHGEAWMQIVRQELKRIRGMP